MNERSTAICGLLAAITFLLAACGGSDGGSPALQPAPAPTPSPAPAPPVVTTCVASPAMPDGVFGAAVSPSNETLILITRGTDLGYGEFASVGFIGTETGTSFVVNSAFRIGSTCQQGSGPARNAYLLPRGVEALVTATVDPAVPSVSGEIRTVASTRTAAGGAIPGTSYDFNRAAEVSTAVGTLVALGTSEASVTILADGSATISIPGCRSIGSVTPRADAKNLLTLVAPPCAGDTFGFTGVVLAYEPTTGGQRLFGHLFVSDGWDWYEYFLAGPRP